MLRRFTIRHRLTATYALMLLMMAIMAVAGVQATRQGEERLRVVYEERAVPVELLSRMNYLLQRNRVLLMDMLINPGSANVEKRLAEARSNVDQLSHAMSRYQAITRPASLSAPFERFIQTQTDYQQNGLNKALEAMGQGDFDEAQFVYLNGVSPLAPPVQAALDDMIRLQVALAGDAYQEAQSHVRAAVAFSLSILVMGLFVGVLLAWRVSRSVTHPLQQADGMAARVASGDLAPVHSIGGGDELGQLGERLEYMRSELARIVSEVRQGSALMAHSSAEISVGVSDLSNRTERQASNLQEVRATLEDMLQVVHGYADVATRASALAVETTGNAKLGGQAVAELVQRIGSVDEKSRRISEITSVIDSIAFQTNILALNAAVEAARAGEQGRGFAVVAQEVRTLAQRSAAAASEIKGLIADAVDAVQQVTSMAGETGERVATIVNQVESVDRLILQLSESTQRQDRDLGTISAAIVSLDDMTQQNAALVEENAAAAVSLRNEATALDGLVGSFRLPE